LIIWPRAYRLHGETKKALLSYDENLKQLRNDGYQRHLRPAEAFSILTGGLEGRLTTDFKQVYNDMFTGYGEWLNMAMERQGDKLITYLDPEGLVWDGAQYVKEPGFKYEERKEFDVTGKASQTHIDLKLFDKQLVRYVYGRTFADLPSEMKEGDKRAQVYLPAEGMVRPVGRGVIVNWLISVSVFFGSVRGVAVVSGAKK